MCLGLTTTTKNWCPAIPKIKLRIKKNKKNKQTKNIGVRFPSGYCEYHWLIKHSLHMMRCHACIQNNRTEKLKILICQLPLAASLFLRLGVCRSFSLSLSGSCLLCKQPYGWKLTGQFFLSCLENATCQQCSWPSDFYSLLSHLPQCFLSLKSKHYVRDVTFGTGEFKSLKLYILIIMDLTAFICCKSYTLIWKVVIVNVIFDWWGTNVYWTLISIQINECHYGFFIQISL